MRKLLVFCFLLGTAVAVFSPVRAQQLSAKATAPVRTIASAYAHRIDSIVNLFIDHQILPGCQVLCLHADTTIFARNYGYLTYDSLSPVTSTTVYDIASLTKPLATTLAFMKLYEDKQLRITDKVGQYLSYTEGTALATITLAELLTHTSGLAPFIPFYRDISSNGSWDTTILRSTKSDDFAVQVADSVYLRTDFPQQIRHKIAAYKVGQKKYVYSDLGFVLLYDIISEVTQQPMENFLLETFYRPMGLSRTGFYPLEFVQDGNIAPTEDDRTFRRQVVRGYVHDQTAALLGGASGNAGLFSNATEIAAILSLLRNGGVYQGRTYLSEKTVQQFVTTCLINGCQRRSLGFDTPSFAGSSAILPAQASRSTYGHQGFTGTVFWYDPVADLTYIFLSNRVYPDVEPNRLAQSKLRLIIHEEIYKALGF